MSMLVNMATYDMICIDPSNGILSVHHRAITWTKIDLLCYGPWEKSSDISIIQINFIWKCLVQNVRHFVEASTYITNHIT